MALDWFYGLDLLVRYPAISILVVGASEFGTLLGRRAHRASGRAALRNHVPVAVVFMLIGTAMVAMGFTGYNIGLTGTHRRFANLLMSVTAALLIMLVIDLDRPSRGLIEVSTQALVEAVRGIGI